MTKFSSQFFSESSQVEIQPAAREFFSPGHSGGALLIHGFAGSIADLRPIADDLQQSGFSVLGLCLPGHGRSVEDLHHSSAEDWVASARTALNRFPTNTKP